MKHLITYWTIGTIFAGSFMVQSIRDCPRDTIETQHILVGAAIWPGLIWAAVYSSIIGVKPAEKGCKVQ